MKQTAGATMLLSRSDVAALLPMSACIAAVEEVFVAHSEQLTIAPGVLGAHVANGGFHVKTAGARMSRGYFAAKVNANFPQNPVRRGLPTIQGGLLLFDADDGSVLAIMDSAEITKLRTAAATAVAARYLARPTSSVATICGCGVQGAVHIEALRSVLPIDTVHAVDVVTTTADRFARDMTARFGIDVRTARSLREATQQSDVVITCTSSRSPFLSLSDLRPGTFVGAIGADAEHKQELMPEVLAASKLVVDILDQCAQIGELHHALDARVMDRGQVHGELANLVSGRIRGRIDATEITVFDSTGTALEDVAAAAVAYERALERGGARFMDLAS